MLSSSTGKTPLCIESSCSLDIVLRRSTCGLNGCSVEKTKVSGKRSRNFLRPPNFSLSFSDRLGTPESAVSSLPTSPAGSGPLSLSASTDTVSSADSDSTDSTMKLQ